MIIYVNIIGLKFKVCRGRDWIDNVQNENINHGDTEVMEGFFTDNRGHLVRVYQNKNEHGLTGFNGLSRMRMLLISNGILGKISV